MFLYKVRFPLLAVGLLSLIGALYSGLIRLGFDLPFIHFDLPEAHGPLMIAAFLGTVIGLERAVALETPWGYLSPLLAGVGGLLALLGVSNGAPQLLIFLSSIVLILMYAVVLKRQLEFFNVIMALGAVSLFIGNLLWLSGEPIYNFVLWWVAFLVLTIAGERLELSRVLSHSKNILSLFSVAVAVFLLGIALERFLPGIGVRIAGVGMIFISLWLLTFGVARVTVRQKGLTRYVAVCLLAGYFWLIIGGAIAVVAGELEPGFVYDAFLHALFLGFTFTMIFGHAPIIFPAVLRIPVPYRAGFYSHLLLLHVSLSLRVGGDIFDLDELHVWGGVGNVAALILFLVNTVSSVVRGLLAKPAKG